MAPSPVLTLAPAVSAVNPTQTGTPPSQNQMQHAALRALVALLLVVAAAVAQPVYPVGTPMLDPPDMSDAGPPVPMFAATLAPLLPGSAHIVAPASNPIRKYNLNDCTGRIKNPIVIRPETPIAEVYLNMRGCTLQDGDTFQPVISVVGMPLARLVIIGGVFQSSVYYIGQIDEIFASENVFEYEDLVKPTTKTIVINSATEY